MAKVTVPRKNAKKKQNEKENTEPELEDAHNSILETIFGDIKNVVGRRSDIGKRSLALKDNDESIIDADDEKEKRERKEKEKAEKEKVKKEAEIVKKTGINILNNLTQAELDEHYSKCIQLCNQNKVNVKNAFKLQLIDYMKIICMKQPSKTENLTLMGCTLGASAKIYAHRVDKVYTDMVKIVAGKEIEVEKEDSDEAFEENILNGVNDANNGTPKRRKRKGSTDSDNEEKDLNLKKIDFDKMLLPESGLDKKKAVNQPQEKPTLPVGVDCFLDCPVQEVDCRISLNPSIFPTFDIVVNNNTLFLNDPHYIGSYENLDPCEYIKDYKELHKYFNIIGVKEQENKEEFINSSLTFDPSSQIELPDSIRLDGDDLDIDCGDGAAPDCWAMDYDEEGLPEPEFSLKSSKSGQVSMNQPKSFSAPSMAKLVSSKSSDYSFFDNSRLDFWAGPSHWSIKRVKGGEKDQKVGSDTNKKTTKKNSHLEFSYESFKNIKRQYTDVDSFTLARKTMSTWSKSRCKFPPDISFTQKSLFSLLKNADLLFVKKDSKTNLLCSAALNENEEETMLNPDDFSGDVSHIDDNDDNLDDHCNGEFEPDIRESLSPLRVDENDHPISTNFELIPAPPKVNKITVKFAKVQKRIDVKLLKRTIWDSMPLERQEEDPVKFSDVFKSLPDKLPKEEAAELSFPIAFMALLHLANEKNLSLKGSENYDDVFVTLDQM